MKISRRKLITNVGATAALATIGHNSRAWRSGSSGWTPAKLSNLFAWYKSDAGVYSDAGTTPSVNGGTVQQWNDQSGVSNINLVPIAGKNQPTYQSAGGMSALNFDASLSQCLASASTIAIGNLSQMSVFVAFRSRIGSLGSSFSYCVPATQPYAAGNFGLINSFSQIQASGQIKSAIQMVFGAPGVNRGQSTDSVGVAVMAGYVLDGVNCNAYWGSLSTPFGAQDINQDWRAQPANTTTQTNIATGGIFRAGTHNGLSAFYDGQIYEIIVTRGVMTSSDVANLQQYLIAKRTCPNVVVTYGSESGGHWGGNGSYLQDPERWSGSGSTSHSLIAGLAPTNALQGMGPGWSSRRVYMIVAIDFGKTIVSAGSSIGGVPIDVNVSIGGNASDFSWFLISATVPNNPENSVTVITSAAVNVVHSQAFMTDSGKLNSIVPTAWQYDFFGTYSPTFTTTGIPVQDGGCILMKSSQQGTNIHSLGQPIYPNVSLPSASNATIYGKTLPNAWWGTGFGCEIPASTVTVDWAGQLSPNAVGDTFINLGIATVALR